jgi:hypothetical protein
VHAARGATADTTHAVFSNTTGRAMAYVAMTRGRENNTVYLYDQNTEAEESRSQAEDIDVLRRGTNRDAEKLMRMIAGGRDDRSTAHDFAASTDREQLPDRAHSLLIERRARSLRRRRLAHQNWQAHQAEHEVRNRFADKHLIRERIRDRGLGLG